MGMPSAPVLPGNNPYGPSGPPPAGLSGGPLSSQPPGGSMYPGPPTGGMHQPPVATKTSSNLNTTQLQQLSAQIKAYRLLSRNLSPPEALLSIVSGRRPTPAMLAAGKINRSPMPPQQRSMMGPVPSPGSMGTDSSGGQPANINLYPPSPSARSQTDSPKPSSQPATTQSQLTQSHSTGGSAPNITISSSGELPLPVRQALSSAQSAPQPLSKDSNTTSEGSPAVKSESSAKVQQKTQVKQTKVAPTGTPQGLDPITILKERENRYSHLLQGLW